MTAPVVFLGIFLSLDALKQGGAIVLGMPGTGKSVLLKAFRGSIATLISQRPKFDVHLLDWDVKKDLYALMTKVTVNARHEGRLWLYDPKGEPTLFEQKAPISNRCVKLGDPEKPNGEWNTLDLICFNGDSIHIVNGVVVMRLHAAQRIDGPAPAPLTAGQISLQTEGAEVFYRDVMVQPIAAVPVEWAEK